MEGEEDVDRHWSVARATPRTIVEQIKLREQSATSTTDAIEAAGNFLDAFERASAAGRKFTAVLRSSSRSPRTRQPDIRKWLLGERRDHAKLATALSRKLPTRAALIKRLVKEGRFRTFCASVEWCWSALAFGDIEAELARVLAPFTAISLDVLTLRGHVVHALIRRAVEPAIEKRVATRESFEVLVSDLAISRAPERKGRATPLDVVGIAIVDQRVVVAVVHLVAPARARAVIERNAKKAMLAGGAAPVGVSERDLAAVDCVVLASIVPLSTNARRVAIRDAVRHASHRWKPVSILVDSGVPEGQLPKGEIFRFTRVPGNDTALQLASLIATAVGERIVRGNDVYADLVPRLRWVHLLKEREYWTAATHPRFLDGRRSHEQ